MWAAIAAVIALGTAPAPAPPPTRIVFASARTAVAQLYSVKPSEEGLAQLTFGAGNWSFPVPSPDGRFVECAGFPRIHLKRPVDASVLGSYERSTAYQITS
jgi:hypothetical protein